jgi:3-oxoacyl-[acyl-carrier-protein] synthase II
VSDGEARVVVTGLGACTPLGDTLDRSWKTLLSGGSAIRPVEHLAVSIDGCHAVALSNAATRPPPLKSAKHAKYAGRAVTCALHALAEAVESARLAERRVEPLRHAVHAATGQTGLDVEEFFPALSLAWADDPHRDFSRLGGRAARLIDPHFSLRSLSNGGLALVAMEIGASGPSTNYVQSEIASALALRAAWWDLRERRADIAVVFACDSLPHPATWLAYDRAGLLSSRPPSAAGSPFDVDRDGLVLGEGAAVLVLERADDAMARGAAALAELVGVYVAQPRGMPGTVDGPALARVISESMQRVQSHAPLTSGQDRSPFVIARGLATARHDSHEAAALATAASKDIVITATKGATGYLGAASGLVEASFAIRAIGDGVVPAIARLRTPDPAFALSFAIAPVSLAERHRVAVTMSGGWSGEWAAIVLGTPGITAS